MSRHTLSYKPPVTTSKGVRSTSGSKSALDLIPGSPERPRANLYNPFGINGRRLLDIKRSIQESAVLTVPRRVLASVAVQNRWSATARAELDQFQRSAITLRDRLLTHQSRVG